MSNHSVRDARANSTIYICKIDVTAFASVMVVLVIAMMMFKVKEQNPHHGIAIDLPKVVNPKSMAGANKDDALIIGIMRDGLIFFGNGRVNVQELPAQIIERIGHGAERKVYIRADARVRYEKVAVVLDGVRAAGLDSVAILTDQRRNYTLAQ